MAVFGGGIGEAEECPLGEIIGQPRPCLCGYGGTRRLLGRHRRRGRADDWGECRCGHGVTDGRGIGSRPYG